MQHSKRLYLRIAIFLAFWLFCFEPVHIRAQLSSEKKTQIKDFGSSLKQLEKKKKKSKSDQKSQTPDDSIIKIRTDLVVSDVLVVNRKGNIIKGLRQNDFIVAEDNKEQEIGLFTFGENANIPRSIVLIIDYSGSQLPFIKNSIEAAKGLVDKLAPNDRMAIVTDDVKILVNFTKDKVLLKSQLDYLQKKAFSKKNGRSEQYTALIAVLNELFDEEDICPIVVFQSDGDELFALKATKTYEELPPVFNSLVFGIPQKNYSFADVYSVVDKSRATIYSVVPGFNFVGLSKQEQVEKMQLMDEKLIEYTSSIWKTKPRTLSKEQLTSYSNWYLKQQLALSEIAKLSGGFLNYVEKPEDADTVYSTILTVINNRYIIGYYPVNQKQNGERRNIKIEVRDHPEYIVLGRKSYFADKEE